VNRASLIRLLVLLPILAACVVGYLYTQTTHATGRPVGPIPAAANAAATVRVDATGIPILVPVPEGFVALDPFRPDHSRLWYELSARIPGCRALTMMVPANTLDADGGAPQGTRPSRVVVVGVPNALDDMPFDGGDFRVVRTRLRGPMEWSPDADPAGQGANAGRVPLVRMGDLVPDAGRVERIALDDAEGFRALVSWGDAAAAGHAAVGMLHTSSRILSISAVALGGPDPADWARSMGDWLHTYTRAAPGGPTAMHRARTADDTERRVSEPVPSG